MQTTIKKSSEKKREKSKDETPRKSVKEDEKLKKVGTTTPRSFGQKSSTVDIYGLKKTPAQSARAPKKIPGLTKTDSSVTPTKDLLKSSPSSISQVSVKSEKKPNVRAQKFEAKTLPNTARKSSRKDLPFSSVTVNSPIARRKLNMTTDSTANSPIAKRAASAIDSKTSKTKQTVRNLERGDSKEISGERQRTKTRTLDDQEIKVFKPDEIDNNTEMQNLSQKLKAKPKAFFVGLDGDSAKINNKSSDEEISYEDDFESYESDFESYHSDQSAKSNDPDSHDDKNEEENIKNEDANDNNVNRSEASQKEGKDEERMLDSGNFDLRDQKSANRTKPSVMEYILEDSEDDKRQSLTDEGFQDMSNSSAVSSMKTHVDTLERPLFIDFSKSKETKRKRKLNEKLKQRANDLLSMITLHEMSFTLFEMKPIPYDLYMATFGRSNYTQIAVQTFDDGITEEVQTDEIVVNHKWTQHPIDFSKHDIYLYPSMNKRLCGKNDEDFVSKFTFLTSKGQNEDVSRYNSDNNYKENPLRIYFEQKHGAGSCEMLPYEDYKSKLGKNDFNATKLRRFLKKVESKVSHILSANAGNTDLANLSTKSNLPFSIGYNTISLNNISDEDLAFLKNQKITNLIFSETKNNLIMSVHRKSSNSIEKCIICLWDISVARLEPIKVVVAIDNVMIGRFKGSTDGIFVAALDDGSIHLWDLSEKPQWRNNVATEENPTDLVEISSKKLTQTEIDREWNLQNSNVGREQFPLKNALQACAYTSSAANITNSSLIDYFVGLEFVGSTNIINVDGGRKIVGQICSLQRIGIITIWSIVQEKNSRDIGKAYWSKMELERTQTITLLNHIDVPIMCSKSEEITNFNLNSAKRRLSNRKVERNKLKRQAVRQKSSDSSEFDVSRPNSAANVKKVLPVAKIICESWENGIVCCDLKIMRVNKLETYLVAKNCGEVLCCSRTAGAIKINRFCVATDLSTVTCLDASPHGLPYFLAATDSGTVNLCSFLDSRVLLTLDCRNGPPIDITDKCQSDHKGRFVSSAAVRSPHNMVDNKLDSKLQINSIHWSHSNACAIHTLLRDGAMLLWDLTYSDINAKSVSPRSACVCASNEGVLALLTPEGDIQVHKLTNEPGNKQYLDLFQKYVTLL